MIRKHISDAIYGDNLLDGRIVFSRGGNVHTSDLAIAAPSFMMFNRLSPTGKIATKANDTGHLWVYDGTWRDTRLDSPGVQGHGWNPDDSLVVLRNGGPQESQGLRFYAPSLPADLASLDIHRTSAGWVTGSPSYGPTTDLARHLGVRDLAAWTWLDGITVGQGLNDDIGGAVFQYRDKHYLLEPGDTQFIQFKKSGSSLAIAITRLREKDVVFYWLDESEIEQLPLYATAAKPKPQEPEKPKDPVMEMMMMPEDVYATFVKVVAKFPHAGSDDDRRQAMAKAVATIRARHGERWVWKTEHANGQSPSKDALGFVPVSEGPIENDKRMKMFMWDMIDGGSRQPNDRVAAHEFREAYVIAIPPMDFLALDDPLPPPTGPKPHVYVGGDNDTGFCDICGQERGAEIHQGVLPGPVKPEPSVCDCAGLRIELNKLKDSVALMRQDMIMFQRDYALASHTHPAQELKLPKLRAKSNGGWLGHTHDIEEVK